MATEPVTKQVAVLVVVALAITVFVYGIVAGIVCMDDVGLWLMRKPSEAMRSLGRGLIAFTPWLMKGLSIVGTAAMFLVEGSLLVHGIAPNSNVVDTVLVPPGGVVAALAPLLVHVGVGAVIGGVVVLVVAAWKRWRPNTAAQVSLKLGVLSNSNISENPEIGLHGAFDLRQTLGRAAVMQCISRGLSRIFIHHPL